jgi:hypothetical protein
VQQGNLLWLTHYGHLTTRAADLKIRFPPGIGLSSSGSMWLGVPAQVISDHRSGWRKLGASGRGAMQTESTRPVE